MPQYEIDKRVYNALNDMLNTRCYTLLHINDVYPKESKDQTIALVSLFLITREVYNQNMSRYGIAFVLSIKDRSLVKEHLLSICEHIIEAENILECDISNIILITNKKATPEITALSKNSIITAVSSVYTDIVQTTKYDNYIKLQLQHLDNQYKLYFIEGKSASKKRKEYSAWYTTRQPKIEIFHEWKLIINPLKGPYSPAKIYICDTNEVNDIIQNTVDYNALDTRVRERSQLINIYQNISITERVCEYLGCYIHDILYIKYKSGESEYRYVTA